MKDQLKSQLEAIKEKVEILLPTVELPQLETKLKTLQSQMELADFWSDQNNAQKVSQEASHLESTIVLWDTLKNQPQDYQELLDMADESDLSDIEQELNQLKDKLNTAETNLLLSGEYDSHNAIVSLHVGNGGQDAEDFTQMLLRMVLRYCEQQGWKTNLIDKSESEVGLKSAMIEIQGPFAYGMLKSEHGVHRLIRLSPFNAKSLRQTSFARFEVLPEIKNDTDIDINPDDLRIDVFRSGGAGGQSVNTTDSAVRITYLPLNLSVTCQNERSQHQNKDSAMKVLKSRLLQLKLEQEAQELKDLRGNMMENAFGSQIRTYTLQPYKLVKDHRTNYEHNNPDKVFDGDLSPFIQAYLHSI